jgi:PEGA domain-containing protein
LNEGEAVIAVDQNQHRERCQVKRLIFVTILVCAVSAAAAENPRVYIEDSQSWEVKAGVGGSDGAVGGGGGGGARPQTAEIVKTFGERCRNVTINNRKERADYVVLLQHEGGKNLIERDNKVVVYNREGDAILSRSTRSLGNSVTEACSAVMKDWMAHPSVNASVSESPATESTDTRLDVTSTPIGADIEVNGNFMGSTPSSLHLAPGEYTVSVKKAGYAGWQRKVKVVGGNVNLMAELEKSGQ